MKVTNVLNCWLDQTIFFSYFPPSHTLFIHLLLLLHFLFAFLSAILKFSISMNSIIKTSNDLTNLLEIESFNTQPIGVSMEYFLRACVADCSFLTQFGLHYYKILSCKLYTMMAFIVNAVHTIFHAEQATNKTLTKQKRSQNRKLVMACFCFLGIVSGRSKYMLYIRI